VKRKRDGAFPECGCGGYEQVDQGGSSNNCALEHLEWDLQLDGDHKEHDVPQTQTKRACYAPEYCKEDRQA